MGRRTRLTPDVHEKIVESVRIGASWDIAARAAGVATKSIRNWRRRGEQGEEPYAAFMYDVERAWAQAVENREHCAWAGGKGASCAMDWLERRAPDKWARRVEHRLRNEITEGILDQLRDALDTATYDSVLAAIAGIESAQPPERSEGELH